MRKNVVSQNWLALRRYGKLFRDLSLEEQEEILFDMEHEMIEGRNKVQFTDKGIFKDSNPKSVAGKERYQEGKSGSMRAPGATIRFSNPHVHDRKGRHIPTEGGERKG
jgi:hypothetical protein